MGGAVSSVDNAVSSVVNTAVNTVKAVVNNPLPVIETVALTAVAGPEAATLGLSSAETAAITNAAVTAANGGDVSQIATAAASAGVGSEVTSAIAPSTSPLEGSAIGTNPNTGAITPSVSPVASAAGGATSGALSAALQGKDILKGAETGGVIGGGAALGAQGVSSLLSDQMPGGGLKYQNVTDPETGAQTQVYPTTGLGSAGVNQLGQTIIPTEGGTGVVGDPNAVLPSSLSEYSASPSLVRQGADGSLIPAYQAGTNSVTPEGLSQYNLEGENTPAQTVTNPTVPGLSKSQQDALQDVFGFGLSTLLAPKGTGSSSVLGSTGSTGSTAQTGATTGTSETPGGTELDPSTGKAPQLVWGDKYSSLKEGLNL